MDKRILYKQENGVVAVVIPADCGLTVDQIAKKMFQLVLNIKL